MIPGSPAALLVRARWRRWLWQALLIVAVAALCGYFAYNAAANLSRRSIPFGLAFLWRPAGFDFPFKLIEWTVTDTYGRAVLVALANTVLVSVLAIVASTILGLTLGIMRLSPNGLARGAATAIVEFVKNTPQLIQIFFIYVAVLQALPPQRESLRLGSVLFLNIRGLFVPAPIAGDVAAPCALAFAVSLAAAIAMWRVCRERSPSSRLLAAVIAIAMPLAVIAYAWSAGAIAGWSVPELKGFNFRGGWAVRPELLALGAGISIYAAAFIAEIVRAAINGIARGQSEAARSLGLTRGQALRLVILPQALRLIIPPLTSQYLNVTKSSSLGAAIAYPELFLMIGGTTLNQTGQAIEAMAIVMSVFLLINLVTSALMNWYNRAVALKER